MEITKTVEVAHPVERVWQTLQPLIVAKMPPGEKQWADLQETPPSPDFLS